MPYGPDICEKRRYSRDRDETRRAGDYAYARIRAKLPKRSRHVERGYEIECRFAEEISIRRLDERQVLDHLFHDLVERWRNETGHLSSVTRMVLHPSYLRIIGLGRGGLPLRRGWIVVQRRRFEQADRRVVVVPDPERSTAHGLCADASGRGKHPRPEQVLAQRF